MFAFRKTYGTEFCSFFKLCFHVIFFLLCCVKSSELSRDELSHGKTLPEWRSPRCSSASSKCGSLLLKTLRCNGIFFRLLSCLFLFFRGKNVNVPRGFCRGFQALHGVNSGGIRKNSSKGATWELPVLRVPSRKARSEMPDFGRFVFAAAKNTSRFLHSHSLRGFQPRRIHWANVKIFCDKTKGVAICAGNICIYHKNNYLCEASEIFGVFYATKYEKIHEGI